MKFYIADAFTTSLFGGNPAGVVVLPEGADFPKDEIMVKTAAELRYSETAFVKVLGDNHFNVRYFTPTDEVDLCGHATIATFYCIQDLIDKNKPCINHTLAGDLTITVEDGFVMMDMATPKTIKTFDKPDEIKAIYEMMGVKYEENQLDLPLTGVSTGLPDLMLPVKDMDQLNALDPDMKALAQFSKDNEFTGVHAFTLNAGDGKTAHARNFAPLYGIDEEAATGTSNGALTYYLYSNKLVSSGDTSHIIQGESMGRPSEIVTTIKEDSGNVNIKVGGKAAILATGEINL